MIRKLAILVLSAILFSCETNHEENSSLILYGDALEDIGYSIAKTVDGFVIGGQLTEVYRSGNSIKLDSSVKKMGIIRTDFTGKVIWKKSFGGDRAAVGSKVIVLSDGSFISAGYIVDPLTNQKDVYVVKVSEDGLSSTEKIYPETGNQFGIDILQTTEGFIILGSTDLARSAEGQGDLGNAEGKRDIYLLRINNNLEKIGTQKALGYPGNDAAVAIRKDPSGGYIITGTTDNSWPDQALNNIFIFKTNSILEATKIQIIGSADDEYTSDIEILEDGYLIAGIVGTDGSDQWVYLTKIQGSIYNAPVYTRKFKVNSKSSTATSFAVRAISLYGEDSFVLAGQAGYGASAKMMIFVADADGNQIPGMEYISTATGTQVAYDILVDDSNNIVAVGKNSFENNSMISLFKIRF
jgi:hypothetical protein